MANISIDELGSTISKIMEEFKEATADDIEESVKATAKQTVTELKQANPSGSGAYGSWKDYNAGWTTKKSSTASYNGYAATVYNKTKYQLTHLLEKGHAKVNGGRTRAFPHISIAEDNAETFFTNDLTKRLRG